MSIDGNSIAKKGKKFTDEHRAELSASKTGVKNPMFGKKLSPESIAKREATKKAKKLLRHFLEYPML